MAGNNLKGICPPDSFCKIKYRDKSFKKMCSLFITCTLNLTSFTNVLISIHFPEEARPINYPQSAPHGHQWEMNLVFREGYACSSNV